MFMTQIDGVLRNAYRSTFQEYSRKLDALQSLMNSGNPESGRVEAALLEVEEARIAHNSARDGLARELVGPALPPKTVVAERHIRETARLLWEVAGRPDGTADCDWHRAEQLVHAAALSASAAG
jgi:hypothetical protein